MFGKLNLLLGAGIVVSLGLAFFVGRDPSEPNYELVPERQMARSPAFGAFAKNPNFPDGLTLRQPPAHTIPRGTQPFPYDESQLHAARAGEELKNPLAFGYPHAREHGAFLYATYCQFCHGEKGKGDGIVSERGVKPILSFLHPQAEKLKDGQMFHILTYGKGNMPAHAAQLSPTDRWSVILHIRALQNRFTEFPNVSLAETKKVFMENCSACHGEDGAGSLLRATKFPTLPDFSSLAWQFSKSNLEITNRIEYGDEPMMPNFRYKLTRDQILALSIYIRSFAIKDSGPTAKAAIPTSAAGLTDVQIFRAFCVVCHNRDGKGEIVRKTFPDIPDFTLAAWHAGKKDAELSKAILSGGKIMPSMKDKLSIADADRMAKFVRSFQDGKFMLEPEKTDIPPLPEDIRALSVLGASVVGFAGSPAGAGRFLAGAALIDGRIDTNPNGGDKLTTDPDIAKRLRTAGVLFREFCIACHGPDGTGVPAMRVTLPLLPDFTKAAFHAQHSDPQILVSILDGKGTQMPSNRGRVNEAHARDLVLFVRAFGPGGIPPVPPDGPAGDFQPRIDLLIRQWEALEQQLRALKQAPPKS